ncbi:MAG: YceI family protein [Chryseolinea sp.]
MNGIKVIVLVLVATGAYGQRFMTERGIVKFFSSAAIEDITATNEKATGLFDTGSGTIAFVVPINQFVFAKSLMQEHFNEKYLESERYPKSTFQGKITGFNPDVATQQTVNAQGKLTIHGVTHDINVPGQITRSDKGLTMSSKFMVELKDYKIEIPRLMWQNIAERVEVTLEFAFRPEE